MPHAAIIGTGSFVPPRVVTNDALREAFGIDTDDAWIRSRTGIEARRFADPGVGTADLATEAARAAIEDAGIEAADLDLIVLCTLSPDRAFPGSGVLVQDKLGLPGGGRFTPCLDVRNQCSGFLYGLQVAAAMVESGRAERVLLVGAETHSAALDLTTRGRTVASLFGDGAGAVVLAPADRGVRRVILGADGRYADELSQRVWDIARRPYIQTDGQGHGSVPPEDLYARMDGQKVFKHAVQRMCEVLVDVCEAEGLALSDIDLFAFHQANLRINRQVQTLLDIPDDRVVHNIQRYGNTTAATIPLLLDEASRSGRLQPGMTVAGVAFGSGFTWGGAVLDWVGPTRTGRPGSAAG